MSHAKSPAHVVAVMRDTELDGLSCVPVADAVMILPGDTCLYKMGRQGRAGPGWGQAGEAGAGIGGDNRVPVLWWARFSDAAKESEVLLGWAHHCSW